MLILVASIYFCTSAVGEGGSLTAQGRRCDPNALAAAHRTMPFGTLLRVCIGRQCVGVVVDDRGPYVRGRDLDLTPAAARKIGMMSRGVARVRVAVPLPQPRPDIIDEVAYNSENRRSMGF